MSVHSGRSAPGQDHRDHDGKDEEDEGDDDNDKDKGTFSTSQATSSQSSSGCSAWVEKLKYQVTFIIVYLNRSEAGPV